MTHALLIVILSSVHETYWFKMVLSFIMLFNLCNSKSLIESLC
jgi:hypothetical protein